MVMLSEFDFRKSLSEFAIIVSSINIAFTAVTNLEDIITFARFIRWLTEGWRHFIYSIVSTILNIFSIDISVDLSVFIFLYLSFLLLCFFSYSKAKVVRSDVFDSLTLGASFTFFIILAFANRAIFESIFAKTDFLRDMLLAAPTTFLLGMGSLFYPVKAYVGRSRRMGFYVYQSSKLGLIIGIATLPFAIDSIMLIFWEKSIVLGSLSKMSSIAMNNHWPVISVVFAMMYLVCVSCLFVSPLMVTNHGVIARRFTLTSVLVLVCLAINYAFTIYELNLTT